MKKVLAVIALALALALPAKAGTFSGDNVFASPGTFTIQSGVSLSGTWNFAGTTVNFTGASVTGITAAAAGNSGEVQWNNTGSLNGLSTLTTNGSDIFTNSTRFYFRDTTDNTKRVLLDLTSLPTATTASLKIAANSTSVVSDTGATNNFLTGINSTGGITKARPTIGNLTDLSAAARLVGSNQTTGAVTELTLGNNLSIVGNQINAATGGITDGDKGDITVSGGGGSWLIDSQAVTYPKIQNVTQNRLLGRVSSGSGQMEELTGTQATGLLDVFTSGAKGLVPAGGGSDPSKFLNQTGSFTTPAGAGTVTTTGTPFINSLAIFSGATSITNLHNALGVEGFIKIGTNDLFTLENAATHRTSLGAGTVTSFSAGDLSPLFTTTESTVTTTPALSFSLTAAPAHNYFGNNTASSGAPAYHQINYTDLTGTASLSAFSVGGPSVVGRDTGTGGLTTLTLQSPIAISGGALIITDGAISRAKLADGIALSVLGRSQNSTGDLGDIATTAGSNAVFRESGSNIGWGTVATGGIADNAVTLAKIQDATANAKLIGSSATGSGAPYSELSPGKNLSINGSSVDAGYFATGENQTGFSSDQYITGSRVTIPAGSLTVGQVYHATFQMGKTAAGTGTISYTVRIGTAGTTSDTAAVSFTAPAAGTAAIDFGAFEVWAYIRSSGASTVVVGITRVEKNALNTGLINTGAQFYVSDHIVGGSFNSSTATKIGVSFNGGSSFSGTLGFVTASLIEPSP